MLNNMKTKHLILSLCALVLSNVAYPYSDSWIDTSTNIKWYFQRTSGNTASLHQDDNDSEYYYPCFGVLGLSLLPDPLTIPTTIYYNNDAYTVTGIDDYAFSEGFLLKSIIIPNSIVSIGRLVFDDCSNLSSIVVNSGNPKYDSRDGCNAIIETTTNTLIAGCKNTIIPESVTKIGDTAFAGSTGLTSITIPQSVATIDDHAFCDCYELISLKVMRFTPPLVKFHVFSDATLNNAILYVPIGSKSAYQASTKWSSFLNIREVITFEDANVKAICVANWDTNGDGELSEAEAAAVTDLGEVFKGNSTITSFNELQYFTGLAEICDNAFLGTSALTSIIIPKNVTRIGESAFDSSINLTNVELPEGLITIDDWAFWESKKLKNINFPSSLRYINRGAFHNTAIESLILPEGVISLGNSAFNFCSLLNEIYIPSTVTTIEEAAFDADGALHTIVVSGENQYFDSRNNCNALIESSTNRLIRGSDQTIIPYGIASINEWAFDFSNITQINIPSTVTTIGDNAFKVCTSLKMVKVDIETPLTITSGTFSRDLYGNSNRDNISLYVPYGCKAAYEAADYWKEFKEIVEMEPPVNIDDTFIAAVPCGEGTANLTFKVTNITPFEVEVSASPEDIAGALTIPATVTDENGIEFAVKSIGEDAFRGRALTSVVLPTGICTINSDAFRESGLESITFPSTLTAVGHSAFQDCKQLESIDFNHCPAYFEYDCFLGCSNLNELYIPNTVQFRNSDYTWAWNIFGSCTSLKTVTFEAFGEGQSRWSTTTLFPDCSALETVVLPSLSVMQQGFFWNSKNLKDITILEIEDDFDARYYSFNKMFQDHQAKDIQFTVPAEKSETMLKAGYINLSDKSGLPIVRTEFESEAARITTMANALNDGAKASLITAIANARSVVNAAEDYATVYAQIDAIKTAAKTFLTTATVPANFDITAVILNPDFEQLQLGWNVQNDWVNYPNVNKRGWNGASYENGEVSIYKFIDTWENTTLKDGDISQTIRALPAGIYRLEADIIATNQNDANAEVTGISLFAGSQKTSVATKNEKPQHFSVEFTHDETGDCTIGINVNNTNANWVAMDNIRLYCMELLDQNDADISQMDNAIYIERTEGMAGSSVSLKVKLKNVLTPNGCAFKLNLPTGFSLVKDTDGDVVYELSDRTKKMSVTLQDWQNGSCDVALTPSTGTATISGAEGTVITFRIQIPEGIAQGDYKMNLTNNIIQSKVSGTTQDFAVADIMATFTVVDYILGDVNGDGNVTPADAIMILYDYFNVSQEGFKEAAADINGDGNITPADAIEALYIYFGVSNANAVKSFMNDMLNPE